MDLRGSSLCSPLPSTPGFDVGNEEVNSGSHACLPDNLPTEHLRSPVNNSSHQRNSIVEHPLYPFMVIQNKEGKQRFTLFNHLTTRLHFFL